MSVLIIAEAGVNHNGDMRLAKQMIEKAKEAGADYIKFQTFIPQHLVSQYAPKADYQQKTTQQNESQLQMLESLALTYDDFRALQAYCKQVGIGFLSTPFDLESLSFLETLAMPFWKIPSGEVTNLPYLEKIGQTKRRVILSTGMCEMQDILEAIQVLKKNGTKDITVLHCNTEYPTPMQDVNLLAMLQMKEVLGVPVGYSDHTTGIEIPIAAVALGATIIEKHFTLDKTMQGPDHQASLNPEELRQMVTAIRNVEKGLGSGIKTQSPSEKKNAAIARKSIVAKTAIKKGELFTEANLTVKRPGTGISPMKWYEVLGQVAQKDYQVDEMI